MKPSVVIDASDIFRKFDHIKFTAGELQSIGYAGSAVVKTSEVMLVAKDTHATELSIDDHIVRSTPTHFEDDIGPETDYAPNIEYGREDMPNYPIQPFIRPSAAGKSRKDTLMAISRAFGETVIRKWQK